MSSTLRRLKHSFRTTAPMFYCQLLKQNARVMYVHPSASRGIVYSRFIVGARVIHVTIRNTSMHTQGSMFMKLYASQKLDGGVQVCRKSVHVLN